MTQAQSLLDTGFAALLAVHGEAATLIPAGGDAVTVQVVFDESAMIAQDAHTVTTGPKAMTWTASASLPEKAQLVVRGVTFNVILAKPDGLGVTHMMLSRDNQVPPAPNGLQVQLQSGQAVLSWNRNSVNNTAVEVWADYGSGFQRITTLGEAIVTYTDVSAGVRYKVRNTNVSGPSAFSYIFDTRLGFLVDEFGNFISDESGALIQG